MKQNNIFIGKDAGIHVTDEKNILHLKCKELDINIIEIMTEREYKLISNVVKVMDFFNKKDTFPLIHSGCSACRTGNCSVHIGYKAGRK